MCVIARDDAAGRLAALLEGSDDAIITTDLNSTITSWNPAAEALFGFSAGEVIGRSILILYPHDGVAQEAELVRRACSGERVMHIDAVRRRRDGRHVVVSLTVVPVRRDASGEVVGTLRIIRDVTDRDRADRALRRLAAIVESTDDAIASKDLDGIVTSWNRAAERMFGYTAAEMIGRSIRVIVPRDRQAEEDGVLAAIRRGDKLDHFETIRRRKDGTLIPVSLTISPIRDEAGRVVGASTIARDISDRRRAEDELARLLAMAEQNAAVAERLSEMGALVASSLDRAKIAQTVIEAATALTAAEMGALFYASVDEDGRLHAVATPGWPAEQVAGLPVPSNAGALDALFGDASLLHSDDLTVDAAFATHAAAPPDGRPPVRSYMAVPVRTRSGELIGGLFFGHRSAAQFDARDERLALGIASWAAVALENARLYTQLQEANRLKDEFLATLSHELRTPLNAILGYARMIRDGILPPERHAKAIGAIERNAASLTQIVEDVLDVSRIVSGKMRLNVRPVDMAEVIRSAIGAVAPAAEAKGIRLHLRLAETGLPIVGDAGRLQQVLWNLLSNAVKFTGRHGRIEVSGTRVGSHVEVAVSDTGIGIAPEFLPYIFERFRQGDASTTRERGGLGLGLAIARQLVEMHGGTIEAASPGRGLGATFRIELPARGADALAPRQGEAAPDAQAALRLSGLRVLVVDDDGDALEMAREMFQSAGAQVAAANSAAAALDIAPRFRPDVIVADLAMPVMDGFALIEQIRQSADPALRDIPAVALTAYARSEDRVKALRAGFQTHLPKPIDPVELMAAVASLTRSGAGSAQPAPPGR